MIIIEVLISIIVLILGNLLINRLDFKRKTSIMIILNVIVILICFCIIFFSVKNNNTTNEINNEWIMKFERTDTDFGNIIYVYSDNRMVIEYCPKELYPSKEKKIDSKVNVQKAYEYIQNNGANNNGDYKVTINNNGNKITKYISKNMVEISDLMGLINQEIVIQLK